MIVAPAGLADVIYGVQIVVVNKWDLSEEYYRMEQRKSSQLFDLGV